jgi:alpha-ribazole phosphatase
MIYLLRHGEIDPSGTKRYVGQVDLPLTQKGEFQAQWWRKTLTNFPLDLIYCSDLMRSRETAQIIAETRQVRIQVMFQLREIDLGEWDGLSVEEVKNRFPEEWQRRGQDLVTYRPPGGENFADMHARVVPLFEHIVQDHREGNVLIVGHSGVNRVILCHLLGIPLAHLFRLGQDYGSLSIIDNEKKEMRLIAMNLTPEFNKEIWHIGNKKDKENLIDYGNFWLVE